MRDEFQGDDVAIPTYLSTNRQVAVGDRGASPVRDGQSGLVVSLTSHRGRHGEILAWSAQLRYPNGIVEQYDAGSLHWVEPTRSVDVYLTDVDIERIQGEPAGELLDDELVENIVHAVRQAVAG